MNREKESVLWHVSLISFYPGTDQNIMNDIHKKYQTLDRECGGKDAGILFWKVDWNLDLRKKVHLVEISIFKDQEAYQAFQIHPKHKEMTDLLSKIADWQVGDINDILPFSLS